MSGIGEHKGEQGKIKNLEGEKRSKTGSDIDLLSINLLSFIKLIELSFLSFLSFIAN
jgi:hypothetical protein